MKSKKSKNTKFVRVDNTTWIEADVWIPDEVARMQFLQRMQIAKPVLSGKVSNENFMIRS